eukprot:GGOE01037036.1.p1 GENE.GGOE01037036.1~~GGOE01037036.1.p1  ORF type:complete len:622 (+),score=141.17 GGOE01037036.1:140-1867(+)
MDKANDNPPPWPYSAESQNPSQIPVPAQNAMQQSTISNRDYDEIEQSIEGAFLHPRPQKADTRLAVFQVGHAPLAGASFSPSIGGLVSRKGSRLQRSNKNVLQRFEERHGRLLMEKTNLAAFASHLRHQKKFKEADKCALRGQLLLEREKTIDVFQDELVEVDTGIPVAPFRSLKLGTPDRPLADPLGLALIKHDMETFGLGTPSSSSSTSKPDSVLRMLDYIDSSAFELPSASEGSLTAGQRLRRFVQMKFSSSLYKRLNIASSREADIQLEKETLLAKQLYQQVAERVQRAKDEHAFVADMFKGMVVACLHGVCQRVLPQEPLCDVLKRYQALRLPSRALRNKEFLPLTQKDLDLCANAWSPAKPEDEVMVNALGMKLLRKDLRTLAGLSWLNDEVINFYLELMRERSSQPGFPKCHFFNTFFYERLSSEGKGYHYGNVRRWTRKVDIFGFDKVIVPIHLSVHWTAAVINFRDRRLEFYDSMGNPGRHHLELLQMYLVDEHRDKKHLPYDTSAWTFHTPGADVPQQRNTSDCGVFCCKFMNCLAQDLPFTFGQQHMPYFRQRLVVELLSSKVL